MWCAVSIDIAGKVWCGVTKALESGPAHLGLLAGAQAHNFILQVAAAIPITIYKLLYLAQILDCTLCSTEYVEQSVGQATGLCGKSIP